MPDIDLQKTYLGDAQKVRQIVTNVIGNAIKFTERGRITVRAWADTDDLINIVVTDTGIGIAEDARDKIFEKFTQADASTTRRYGGTGLGLTICKNFAQLMGGELSLDQAQGSHGTVVTVRLPLKAVGSNDKVELGTLGLLTADDTLAESVINHAELAGYRCVRVKEIHEQDVKHLTAIIADELQSQMMLDAIEQLAQPSQKLLLTSIRSHSNRLGNDSWVGVHRPLTSANLLESLTQSADEQPSTGPSTRFHGTVLVVEDNRVNQILVNEVLQELGLSVSVAENGLEAVDMFKQRPFNVVLMDCQMPVMDGFEATRRIRAHEQELQLDPTPIIALTAAARSEEYHDAMDSGMNDFMTKPFNATDLEQRLATYFQEQALTDTDPAPAKVSDSIQESPEGPALINASTIDNILSISPDNGPRLLRRVMDTFLQQLPISLEELAQLVDIDDSEELRKRAHAAKSMCLNMGADALAVRLNQLEQAASDGRPPLKAEEISELEELAIETRQALEPWKDHGNAA